MIRHAIAYGLRSLQDRGAIGIGDRGYRCVSNDTPLNPRLLSMTPPASFLALRAVARILRKSLRILFRFSVHAASDCRGGSNAPLTTRCLSHACTRLERVHQANCSTNAHMTGAAAGSHSPVLARGASLPVARLSRVGSHVPKVLRRVCPSSACHESACVICPGRNHLIRSLLKVVATCFSDIG